MSNTGQWGLENYGLDQWGSLLGSGGTLALVSAMSDSERTVLVTFNVQPLQVSTIGAGDALNPASWKVTKPSTGQVFVVMAVRAVTPVQFQLYLLQKLGPYLVDHVVDASAIVAPNLTPLAPPTTFTFGGSQFAQPAPTAQSTVDFVNAPTSSNEIAGVLRVSSSGDYVMGGGVDFLRKLIYRRLTTGPGEFFYLPNYGLGLREKGPVTSARLAQLKPQIEQQVLQEPEISAATATLIMDLSTNILKIFLNVTLAKTNQQIPLDIPVKMAA